MRQTAGHQIFWRIQVNITVYPKKYAYGFCFAVLCCGYTLTDFPVSIRLTSLALWQSNDCPSASKATLMNMDKYFMWIHYERLHNHNKAKHNKTVCIFLGIYCMLLVPRFLFNTSSINKRVIFFFKNVILFPNVLPINPIFLHEPWPREWIFSQYCGYWCRIKSYSAGYAPMHFQLLKN